MARTKRQARELDRNKCPRKQLATRAIRLKARPNEKFIMDLTIDSAEDKESEENDEEILKIDSDT